MRAGFSGFSVAFAFIGSRSGRRSGCLPSFLGCGQFIGQQLVEDSRPVKVNAISIRL